MPTYVVDVGLDVTDFERVLQMWKRPWVGVTRDDRIMNKKMPPGTGDHTEGNGCYDDLEDLIFCCCSACSAVKYIARVVAEEDVAAVAASGCPLLAETQYRPFRNKPKSGLRLVSIF